MKDRIKQIRKDKKMTQEAFGKILGVKGNTITNYENGMRNPSDAIITSICREFNVNPTWLRTGEGDVYKQPTDDLSEVIAEIVNDESPVRDSLLKIMKAYMQLDDASKQVIDGFITELHNSIKKEDR